MPSRAIRAELSTFDGKRVDPFRKVAAGLPKSVDSLDGMLRLAAASRQPEIHVGATWIAKHLLESEVGAPKDLAATVVSLLRLVESTDARLHLLQILPYSSPTPTQGRQLIPLLEPLLVNANAFVRAWAYNALGIAAASAPELRQAVLERLDRALESEKPAVKVRARKAKELLG